MPIDFERILEQAQVRARVQALESACELAKATLIAIKGEGLQTKQEQWADEALSVLKGATAMRGPKT